MASATLAGMVMRDLADTADWIAVDWGTSNLRAWGINAAGSVAFYRASDKGMSRLAKDEFALALGELLEGVEAAVKPLEVLICGMAGARQGWVEAPYLDTPASLLALADGAVQPSTEAGKQVRILPGVCQRKGGAEDVMRGEETQILGLVESSPGFSGLVCMPGTHSKWVHVSGSCINSFSTAMTGELFEILKTHSVLRHALPGELTGPEREAGFSEGVAQSVAAPERLTSLLFKVRASALLSQRAPAWCAGYLSGLLIGAEIAPHLPEVRGREVPLVGSLALCRLYAEALRQAGSSARVIDATDAALAGLKAARRQG